MSQQVYVAFYKHKVNVKSWQTFKECIVDGVIRTATRSNYSHCELAIERSDGSFCCYSSSSRDGGVRKKCMDLPGAKWVLEPVSVSKRRVIDYYNDTKDMHYDFAGAMGLVTAVRAAKDKVFCSEWVFNCLFASDEGWRFSPGQLATIVRLRKKKRM